VLLLIGWTPEEGSPGGVRRVRGCRRQQGVEFCSSSRPFSVLSQVAVEVREGRNSSWGAQVTRPAIL
jgi:hypothetical protein